VGGAVEESLSQQAGIDATFAQLLALDPGLLSNILKFSITLSVTGI